LAAKGIVISDSVGISSSNTVPFASVASAEAVAQSQFPIPALLPFNLVGASPIPTAMTLQQQPGLLGMNFSQDASYNSQLDPQIMNSQLNQALLAAMGFGLPPTQQVQQHQQQLGISQLAQLPQEQQDVTNSFRL
jgi:hypothetical protein